MKAKLATEIGTRAYLRIYWSGNCSKGECHNALNFLKDSLILKDWNMCGEPKDHADETWPTHCKDCGVEVPKEGITKQIHTKRLYDTLSGELEPGYLFWASWYPDNMFWDNHQGPHLCAILPNGREWIIDSRASNCGSPNDRVHRCWVRHGEAPEITVNKNGQTCSAGGGSIWVDDYHGFLQDGNFT